jgi:hypothetical protein
MKDDILSALQAVLDAEHAAAVLDHRKTKKCALTPFAAKLLAKEFGKCSDPNAAAEEMILRGWAGFRADWMARSKPNAGKRTVFDVAAERFSAGEPESQRSIRSH